MNDNIRYISLAGGGNKGIMYIGMIRAIDDHLYRVRGITYSQWMSSMEGFAGTSIGSLTALSMLLNLSPDSLFTTLSPFMDNLQMLVPRPDIAGLFQKYGLDDGMCLRRLIEQVLNAGGLSPRITFADLKRLLLRQFAVVATNAHTQEAMIFSAETTPGVSVLDAVYMSMTMPFLFEPMRYNGDIMLDGALSENIPHCFPPDSTLYCIFDTTQRYLQINSFAEFMTAVAFSTVDGSSAMSESSNTLLLKSPLFLRNESGTNFHLNNTQVETRLRCGYASALAYMYPLFTCTIVQVIEFVHECFLAQAANTCFDSFCGV